jgi:hypothetical protein
MTKYVIYNRETTLYMPGMKRGGYANKGAATRALKKRAEDDLYFGEIYRTNDAFAKEYYADPDNKNPYLATKMATITELGIPERDYYTAMNRGDPCGVKVEDYEIATRDDFDDIEKWVTRTNLMSGKDYRERINTPPYMSPAYETYWSL